jgi:hypothetical protein
MPDSPPDQDLFHLMHHVIGVAVAQAKHIEPLSVRESIVVDVAELLASVTAGIVATHSFFVECAAQTTELYKQHP